MPSEVKNINEILKDMLKPENLGSNMKKYFELLVTGYNFLSIHEQKKNYFLSNCHVTLLVLIKKS